ncbi:MAG TPA: murein biosynthesis integral membrane protein MurJ [Chloroflexota bacterium]|nr:murein biosynthesis integral membrane protein MurJ [Chloroflexota bacterium]
MTASPQQATAPPRVGRLAGAAVILSASFILSRVLGVVRLSVIAAVFGDSGAIQAYFAAFRIPDTMFLLVSGGALASAFVPLFAGLIEQGDEETAWDMASTVLSSVVIALAVLAGLAFLFAPLVMDFLVGSSANGQHGFTPAERTLTIQLTRIMLLQPIFLGAGAIVASILQTYHRFVPTAVAPLIYNVAVIVGALLGHAYGVVGLSWAVVIGAFGQLAIQIPGLWPAARHRLRPALEWASVEVREVLRLFTPRVIGLAAFQVMLFITLYLAARLPHNMVAAINYSWPLIAFPQGALGMAAGTAIFPTLSRLTAADDIAAVRRTVNRSLRLILFLALPSMAGLIVLRRPIVDLLYAHGSHWSTLATEDVAFALLFYALAIAPLAAIEILARVFYAMRDTYTPAVIAGVAVALDAVLSILFVHIMPPASGQGGLALATAIAEAVQVLWLAHAADRRLGGIGRLSLLGASRDALIAALGMALVLYLLLDPLGAVFGYHGFGVLIIVAVELAVGVGIFCGIAWFLGAPELEDVLALARRR